ncbi:unnamed protein product [Ceutorhynchus assimilis]|uniref:Thioredoxin domain-containing protein n=1 Tax=Ceutorhynchus assimilis TaxID=467358 RepID=A0A9N9MMF3_9CUCU|nr:unnamed protein product [Ceutorhynchus assimilis]
MVILDLESLDELDSRLDKAGDKLIILEFYAPWCGACKMIENKVKEIALEFPDILILKIDVEEHEDIAQDYDVAGMPTFVFIKNKVIVNQFSGTKHEKLREDIEKYK